MLTQPVSGYLMVSYPLFAGRLHSHRATAPCTLLVPSKWVALPRTFAPLLLPHHDRCGHLYHLRGLSHEIHRRLTCPPLVERPPPPLTIIRVSLLQTVLTLTKMALGNNPLEGPSNRPALATKNTWPALEGLVCSIFPDLRPPITMAV
jgi:hypothetical protein